MAGVWKKKIWLARALKSGASFSCGYWEVRGDGNCH
jgi:hypothetical protein